MNAWLITWEWSGEAAAVADAVAAILDPRYSEKRIVGIVEFLYAKRTSTAAELKSYAGLGSRNPYRVEHDFNGIIACGHNPFLRARLVKDLCVSTDPTTRTESIEWTEPPLYKPQEHGLPIIVRAPIRMKCVREITGALSDELIWDRAKGRYKPGWESHNPGYPAKEVDI